MTSPDTEGRKLRGVQVCGTLGELEERAGRERLDQKLEKRWVSMGRALNAKLKSLDFRLTWVIESPWKVQQYVCGEGVESAF